MAVAGAACSPPARARPLLAAGPRPALRAFGVRVRPRPRVWSALSPLRAKAPVPPRGRDGLSLWALPQPRCWVLIPAEPRAGERGAAPFRPLPPSSDTQTRPCCCFYYIVVDLREEGGGRGERNIRGERESWIDCRLPPPPGDQGHNPGLCPDWESNPDLLAHRSALSLGPSVVAVTPLPSGGRGSGRAALLGAEKVGQPPRGEAPAVGGGAAGGARLLAGCVDRLALGKGR